MQVSFGNISAPAHRITREQLLKTDVKNLLRGPYGHPYTGRSILGGSTTTDNSILGKLKRAKGIIMGQEGQSSRIKPSTDNIDTTADFFKSAGKAIKSGLSEILDSLF